ncbi:lysophosphatidylserine lipase ABHD12-like [Montipora capricornis]|uniref:lysophosphatidylserine lipase ABHD12-like n=1 Tax=Montipora capricornis TaxID=246305 RepID=UPI0035F1A03E
MSGEVRNRSNASKTTFSDLSREEKVAVNFVDKKQHYRTLLLSFLLGIISFAGFLVKSVFGTVTALYILCVIMMYCSPAAIDIVIFLESLKNPFHNLSDPVSFGLPSNTINFYINGTAGKLGAWDIPGKHVSHIQDSEVDKHAHLRDRRPVILYLHGNAYTRGGGHRVELYKRLNSLGYHVVTIDYRGFGDSEGKPSESGVIEDGLTAMKWIRSHSSNAPVYIWGHSLGSGVGGAVARILCNEGSPPTGLILEAPFNNLREAAKHFPLTLPFRYLPYYNETVLDKLEGLFRTDRRLADVYCPILILHDRADFTLPIELGRKLYESVKNSRRPSADPVKFVELDGNHGHKYIYESERLPGILRDFIKTV